MEEKERNSEDIKQSSRTVTGYGGVICFFIAAFLCPGAFYAVDKFRGGINFLFLITLLLAIAGVILSIKGLIISFQNKYRSLAGSIAGVLLNVAFLFVFLIIIPWAYRISGIDTLPDYKCICNMKNLALAMEMYKTDYNSYPEDLNMVIPEYLRKKVQCDLLPYNIKSLIFPPAPIDYEYTCSQDGKNFTIFCKNAPGHSSLSEEGYPQFSPGNGLVTNYKRK